MSASVPSAALPLITSTLHTFAAEARPMLVLLLEAFFFTSTLVPLFLLFIYFSTASLRRSLMWNVLLCEIILGLAVGVWAAEVMIRPFLNPLDPHLLRDSIPMIALWSITPWLVDLVLFLRVLKVYPLERGRRMTYAAIITFPVAVKVARAVTGAIYISHFVPEARHASLSMFGAPSVIGWAKSPLPKIGWILQLADNSYASALFLWKLRSGLRSGDETEIYPSHSTFHSMTRRIRSVFWIAATNFIFPVFFNFALLFTPYPSYSAVYVSLANIYVTLFGVVFAMVWSSAWPWKAQKTCPCRESCSDASSGNLALRETGRYLGTRAV